MSSSEAIVVEGLSKTYNGSVKAVENVSFTVHAGEAFGFLGPNGAGKTTTVAILTAGLLPTAGHAHVDGIDVFAHPDAIKQRIGLVFQESTADSDLTGRENLELAAALFDVPRREVRRRVDRAARPYADRGRGRPPRQDVTRAACGGASSSPWGSSTPRACSSWTSRRSGSTRRAGRAFGATSKSCARTTG